MKYYVYAYRQFSECDVTEFQTKEQALDYVSEQDPEDGDGWCQIIYGQEVKYRIKRVAYEDNE